MVSDEARTDQEHRAPFQVRASKAIEEVLARHGLAAPFQTQGKAMFVEFEWKGRNYELAIFPGEINMREGRHLYECFLREEFATEDTYIASFCRRLDNFLAGGEW